MPNAITTQLLQAQSILNSGSEGALQLFYTQMSKAGYGYATLALGIINNSTLAGSSAQAFLDNAASSQGVTLTPSQTTTIEMGLANAYVSTLINDSLNNPSASGITDITYQEAYTFHANVYAANGVSAEGWPLTAPGEVLAPSVMQLLWTQIINPNGVVSDAGLLELIDTMQFETTIGNLTALQWIGNGAVAAVEGLIGSVGSVTGSDASTGVVDTIVDPETGVIYQVTDGPADFGAVPTSTSVLIPTTGGSGTSQTFQLSPNLNGLAENVTIDGSGNIVLSVGGSTLLSAGPGDVVAISQISAGASGQASIAYNGQGGTLYLSNSSITIEEGAQATILGSGNTITAAENSDLELSSQSLGNIISATLDTTVVVDDGAQCTIANASTISAGNDTSVTLQGNNAAVTTGDNSTLNVDANSNNDTVTAGAGSSVSVASGDQGAIVNADGAAVTLGDNSQAAISGSNDDIIVGANSSVELGTQSISDIVAMTTGSIAVIDNGAQATIANASSISLGNNGDVTVKGNTATDDSEADAVKTLSLDGIAALSLSSDASFSVNDGVISASDKAGDLSGDITLSSTGLSSQWSNADGSFSVSYNTDSTSTDTTVQWTQNGQTFTGGDLGSFLNSVDGQVMQAVYNQALQSGSIDIASAMGIVADGVSLALDNAGSSFYLADRLDLAGISDKWAPFNITADVVNGIALAWSQDAAIQQALAFGVAQAQWQLLEGMPSSFTVRVLGFGNDPAQSGEPSSTGDILPLVLDLSGNGINLVAPWQSNANFDLNADGQREATGWVGADNGILVMDLNGNGIIDSAAEWFGESFSADGTTPPAGQSGFAALATLTVSGSTTFSSDTALIDPATGKSYFDEVQIWVDANQDGITDKGELHTLAELGISSIDLQSTPDGRQVAGGEIASTAGFTKTDGTRGDIADVGLVADGQAVSAGTWVPSTAALVFAEYASKGYAAMAEGQAQGVLTALPGGDIDISNSVAQIQSYMIDRSLTWEGFSNPLFGVQDKTMITTYLGDDYSDQRESTAGVDAVALLQAGAVFETTTSNTAAAAVAGAGAIVTAQTAAEVANATGTAADRAQADSTASNAATAWGNAIASYLNANATSLQLNASMETLRQELNELVPVNDSYTQSLPGGYSYFSGVDANLAGAAFSGYAGALQLFNNMKIALDGVLAALAQSAGYTQAYVGQAGATVTVGNDFNLILAGTGAETFVLGSNTDQVIITSATGSVTLQAFQTGTSGDQLQFLGLGDSVSVENIAGGIRLVSSDGQQYADLLGVDAANFNLFSNLTGVSAISFADYTQAGTRSIEGERLYDGEVHITKITASNFGDTLIGDSEATTLIGGSGNDTFVVEGTGYYIDGGDGNDLVSYAKLDGGVTVNLNTGTDSMGSTIFHVEQVTGTAYRDYLTGDTQDNVFDGGAGNDTITGGGGNDTYLFGRGDGVDTIVNGVAANGGASSVLQLKAGIGADDLWLSRQGNDLVIQILGTTDRVDVSNWFANSYSELGAIVLDNGLALDDAAINNLVGVLAAYQQANPTFDPAQATAMPAGVSLAPSFSNHVEVPQVGQASNVVLDTQQDYQSGRASNGSTTAYTIASIVSQNINAINNQNAAVWSAFAQVSPFDDPSGSHIYRYQISETPGVTYVVDTERNYNTPGILFGRPADVTSWTELGSLSADSIYFIRTGGPYILIEAPASDLSNVMANIGNAVADMAPLIPLAQTIGAAEAARQQALGAAVQANASHTADASVQAKSAASAFEQQFGAAVAAYQGVSGYLSAAANALNLNYAILAGIIPAGYTFYTPTETAKYNALQAAQTTAQNDYNVVAAQMSSLLNTFAGMGDWSTVQFAGAGAIATADAGGDLLIAADGGNHTLLGGGGRDTFAFVNANAAALDTVDNFQTGAAGDRLLLVPTGADTAYFGENAAGAATISYEVSSGALTTIQLTGVNYQQLSLYDNLQGIDTANFSTMSHGAVVALNSITPRDFDGYTHVQNLVGSAFADTLSGDGQDNILTGGKGNDTLLGGAGNDTYVWQKGDGNDLIIDQDDGVTTNSQDVLDLANVSAQDVRFTHSGNDLLVTVLSTNETITIQDQYSNPDDVVELVRFADGSQRALPTENFLPVGAVTLSLAGTALTASTALIQGQTLAVTNNLTDADGLGAITYQWFANDVVITGATGNSFTLSAAQIGTTISVTASYTDGYGTAELVTSAASGVVVSANAAPVGSVTITGTAVQGQVLTAANTLTDADGLGAISYQWYADNVAIAGATGDSLTLFQAQVGKTITVAASYTDGRGTAESVDSVATVAVVHADKPVTGDVTMLLNGAVVAAGDALKQGDVLTATNTLADADGLGVISYQWFANGVAITGATADSLTLAQEQVGTNISVQASYVDGFGTPESATSIATAAVANVNDAPVGSLDIAGTVAQGQILTAMNNFVDADGVGAVSYQWFADGVAIAGATTGSLALAQAQVGKSISVTAAYTDGFGTVESVASTATAAVANINDAPTGAVTISGVSTQGQTLTVSNTLADADGLGAISYQWYANGVAINGATADSFTLTLAQVGQTISVNAGYTDGFGTLESVASAATAAVAHVNAAPTGAVTISGIAEQGQMLTVSNTLADADGLGAISYQWYADGVAINGATGSSFTLGQAQVGAAMTVEAGYSDGFGTAESVASTATAAVANVNDAPVGSVTISGTVAQGQTLTLTNNLADADGLGTIRYQWYADGVAIDGATTDSFTLTQAQLGMHISASASYIDGFGTAETVNAIATAAVTEFQMPTVTQALAAQTATANSVWTFALPASLFNEAQAGDPLTYTATLADGSALPAWLTFDPVLQVFSGMPTDQTVGALALKITATDTVGLAASTTLNVQVNGVYQVPTSTVSGDLGIAHLVARSNWVYALPSGLFAESVAGDTLTYTATLADGSALPSWLTFDPVLKVFSGSPTDQAAGILTLKITGTDMGGLATSTTMGIQIYPFGAPTLSEGFYQMVALPSANSYANPSLYPYAWQYTLPAGLFSPNVPGGTLAYLARMADGTALPSWLTFDETTLTFSGKPPSTWTPGEMDIEISAGQTGYPVTNTILHLEWQSAVSSVTDGQDIPVSSQQQGVWESGNNAQIVVNDGNHTVLVSGDSDTTTINSTQNTIIVSGNADTVSTGSTTSNDIVILNNIITVAGDSDTAKLSGGVNTVVISGNSDTVTSGTTFSPTLGNNTLQITGDSDTYSGTRENDTIIVSGNLDNISFHGMGNNTVTLNGNSDSITCVLLTGGTFVAAGASESIAVGLGTSNMEFAGPGGTLTFLNLSAASNELWFQHVGQDLQITFGETAKTTLKNWYAATPDQAEQIVAGDGKILSHNNVELLVQAMAAFAPPSSSSTQAAWTPAEQQALQPLVAYAWH
jgi:hypothetical protein